MLVGVLGVCQGGGGVGVCRGGVGGACHAGVSMCVSVSISVGVSRGVSVGVAYRWYHSAFQSIRLAVVSGGVSGGVLGVDQGHVSVCICGYIRGRVSGRGLPLVSQFIPLQPMGQSQ